MQKTSSWTMSRTVLDHKHLELSQGKPQTVCCYHICTNSHTPAALTCKMHGCPWDVAQGKREEQRVGKKKIKTITWSTEGKYKWNQWKVEGPRVKAECRVKKNRKVKQEKRVEKRRKVKKEKCRDSAVWHESWSSNHNCFPLSFILSRCVWPRTLLGWCQTLSPPHFPLSRGLIGWRWTALHCRWEMTPTFFTSNQNNTIPRSPLYIQHEHRHLHHFHFCHANRFSLLCAARLMLHTHHHQSLQGWSHLHWTGDAFLHYRASQISYHQQNLSK